MAPSSLGKKSKKAESKVATETKTVASSAESSSKPSKTLKRKKDAEGEAPVVEDAELPKSSKKAKKDELSVSKVSKSIKAPKDVPKVVEKIVEATVPVKTAEKKKKNRAVSETAAEPSTKPPVVEEEEKTKKTKAKAKDSAMAAAAESSAPVSILKKPKSILKQPKPAEPVPTFISRPRKADTPTKTKSKKTKANSPEPVDEDEEEQEQEHAEDAGQSDEDEEVHLHGFSTDDDDSSDEEDAMDVEPSQFDIGKLPTIAKDDATVARKLEKAKKYPGEDRGVLALSRLPHGFYEDQLRGYFSQFGNVTRLRISRNKKTGKSKHYGFIEFDSSAVAQIVADTMDNYLLMGHIMRCKVIPKDQVHPELWVGANRKWRVVPRDRVARVEHNKPRTTAEQVKAGNRLLKRQQERKAKLAKAGIEYDFDAAAYKKPTTTPAQT